VLERASLVVDSPAIVVDAPDVADVIRRTGRILTLGELIASGRSPIGRDSAPIVFRSVGAAFQDLALSMRVVRSLGDMAQPE
jgi:ornithine cyclodeaminase/alanine dehydrogenase-like protein (mu-crystallin family)